SSPSLASIGRTRSGSRAATPRPTRTASPIRVETRRAGSGARPDRLQSGGPWSGPRTRLRAKVRAANQTDAASRRGLTTMHDSLPWLSLVLLGAFHGLNPGMGWLFAVALGLQAGRRTAVIGALGPIAAGHLASIAVVVVLVGVARLVVPLAV